MKKLTVAISMALQTRLETWYSTITDGILFRPENRPIIAKTQGSQLVS
jgi:hypothetical protein